MYKKETKPSQNKRLYEDDIAIINSRLSEGYPRIADYVHYLLVEHGNIDEGGQTVQASNTSPVPEVAKSGKRTPLTEDELQALLAKTRPVTQEEAYESRPLSPYYYPYKEGKGGVLIKRT